MVQVVQQPNITPASQLQENKRLQAMARKIGLVTLEDRAARQTKDAVVPYQDPTITGLRRDIDEFQQADQLVDKEVQADTSPMSAEEIANVINQPVYTATIDEEAAKQEALRKRNLLTPMIAEAASRVGYEGVTTLPGLAKRATALSAVGIDGQTTTDVFGRMAKTSKYMADTLNLSVSKAQKKSFLEQGSWKVAEAAKMKTKGVEPKPGVDDDSITFGEYTPATNPMWKGDATLNISPTNILLDVVGAGALNEKGSIIIDPEFYNIMALNTEASFVEGMYSTDRVLNKVVEETKTEIAKEATQKDKIKFGIASPEPTVIGAEQEYKEYVVKKSKGLEALGKNIYREYKQMRAAIDGLPTDSYMREIEDINKGVFTQIGSVAKELYVAANSDLIVAPPRSGNERAPVEFLINREGSKKYEEAYKMYSTLFGSQEVKPQPFAGNNGVIAGEGTQITRRMTTFMGEVNGKKDYYGNTDMSFEAMENQNSVMLTNDPQRTMLSTLFFMFGLGNGGKVQRAIDQMGNPIPNTPAQFIDGPNGQNFYTDVFGIGKIKWEKLQAEKRALLQNVKDLKADPKVLEADIAFAQKVADAYDPQTIFNLERQKAISIQEAMLRWDGRPNHLTYALQLLTGRMHAQQTLYNPQAHKQIRMVTGGGNKYQYIPGTMGPAETIFVEGMTANLFEDPKVKDIPRDSWKKEKGFRMPEEERIKTFRAEQATRGQGGLWDQYVAWGQELKGLLNLDKKEARTYLYQIKNAANNPRQAGNIGNTLKQRYGTDPVSPKLKRYLANFEHEGIRIADYLIALSDYDRVFEYNKANPKNKIKFTDTQQFEVDGKTHGPGTMGMQFGSVSMAKRSDMIMDIPWVEKIQSEEYKDLRDAMASTMVNELTRSIESGKLAGFGSNTQAALRTILDKAISDRENFLKKSPMTMGYGQQIEALKRHVEKTVYESDDIRELIAANGLGMKRTINFLHTMMVDSIFQNMDANAIEAMDTLKAVGWQSVLINDMIEIPQPTGIKTYAAGQVFEKSGALQWKAPTGTITKSGQVTDTLYKGKASAQGIRIRNEGGTESREIGGWTVSRILASLIQAYDASMTTGVFTNSKYNHNGGPPLRTGNWDRVVETAKRNGSNVKEVINKKTGKKEFIGQPFVFQNYDAFVGDSGTIGIVREIANQIHKHDIINEDAASKVFNWYRTGFKAALKRLSEDDTSYDMLTQGTPILGLGIDEEPGQYMKVAELFSGERYASKTKPNPYKNLTKFIKKNISVPWDRKTTGESLAKWQDRKQDIARAIAHEIEKDLGKVFGINNQEVKPIQMSKLDANKLSAITGKSEASLLAQNKKDMSSVPDNPIDVMHSTGKLTGKQIAKIISVINSHLDLDQRIKKTEANIVKGKAEMKRRMTKTNNIDF